MAFQYSPVVEAWRRQSKTYNVDGVATQVWEHGDGEPVVCIHGVPASAYCYRKLLPELAQRGLRGIAFDLPGLGLADRPEEFDYSWSHLGLYATKLIERLQLEKFHLLVHDIGGPVGFGILSRIGERVKSITILNTMTLATRFRPHPSMAIFRQPIIGELALKVMRPSFLAVALNTHGFVSKLHRDDYLAYYQLLKGTNEGKSFLRIMRGFELTKAFENTVTQAAANYHGPRQIIWGVRDHALPVAYYGEHAKEVFRCETLIPLNAKHFLQEDCYVELADAVASQARGFS